MLNFKEIIASLNELASPVKEAFEFRARNVFFSSFILSWVCINWEALFYFILSDDKVLNKINNINTTSFLPLSEQWEIIKYNPRFTIPLTISLLVTIFYPAFTLCTSIIHKKIISKIDEIINERNDSIESKREKNRAKTDMEIQEYRDKAFKSKHNIERMLQLTAEHDVQVQTLEQNKISLNTFITELSKRKEELTSEVQSLNEELIPMRTNSDFLKNAINENLSIKYELEKSMAEITQKNNEINANKESLRMSHGEINLLNQNREQLISMIKQAGIFTASISNEINNSASMKEIDKNKLSNLIEQLSMTLDSNSIPTHHNFEGL